MLSNCRSRDWRDFYILCNRLDHHNHGDKGKKNRTATATQLRNMGKKQTFRLQGKQNCPQLRPLSKLLANEDGERTSLPKNTAWLRHVDFGLKEWHERKRGRSQWVMWWGAGSAMQLVRRAFQAQVGGRERGANMRALGIPAYSFA